MFEKKKTDITIRDHSSMIPCELFQEIASPDLSTDGTSTAAHHHQMREMLVESLGGLLDLDPVDGSKSVLKTHLNNRPTSR